MAEKSQASDAFTTERYAEWKALWSVSDTPEAETIEARVRLGKDALKLRRWIGYDQVLEHLDSITNDRARSHRVLRVAMLPREIVTYAKREARKGNRISWTHLADIASIVEPKKQEEVICRCVDRNLSILKLKKMLVEEYGYVPEQKTTRVTRLANAFLRELGKLRATTGRILAEDKGKSFIEATKQVKPDDRKDAIPGLDEGLKLLSDFKSEAKSLERCLTKAKERLEKLREEDAEQQ